MNVADSRNRFRQHVRAAREWLGRAESSLDKENDIRGDLNVMLAQAELQHAKESKVLTGKERIFRRLLPFMAAALLFSCGFVCLYFVRSPVPVQIIPDKSPVQHEVSVPEVVDNKAVAYRQEAEAAAPLPTDRPIVHEPVQIQTERQQTQKADIPEPKTDAAENIIKPAASDVPSAEMQKLMLSAGKTLRTK